MRPFTTLLFLALSATAGSAFCPKAFPVTCSPKEHNCPMGNDPFTDCPLEDVCAPNADFNCPDNCPCPKNQMECAIPAKMEEGPSPCAQSMCVDLFPKSGTIGRGYEKKYIPVSDANIKSPI